MKTLFRKINELYSLIQKCEWTVSEKNHIKYLKIGKMQHLSETLNGCKFHVLRLKRFQIVPMPYIEIMQIAQALIFSFSFSLQARDKHAKKHGIKQFLATQTKQYMDSGQRIEKVYKSAYLIITSQFVCNRF